MLRWARKRAPALLEEAEREAVLALRDALVDAALSASEPVDRRPARKMTTERKPAPPQEAGPGGELFWAYCVLRADDTHPVGLEGVDSSGRVEREQAAGLAALVSRVPHSEFAAESLRRNLNDIEWLERVARAHEAVLETVLETSTIVPLRMCTIYESAESVRDMLARERDRLIEGLGALEGRLEWAVKVTADRERMLQRARAEGQPAHEDPMPRGEGGAYMLRRRRDRHVRELADSLATDIAEQVHARLQDWAIGAVTRPPQNPELSGHEGQMLLNAAYLVERSRGDELRELVAELEARHAELGARIELTGPWPPYNFVPSGTSAALA